MSAQTIERLRERLDEAATTRSFTQNQRQSKTEQIRSLRPNVLALRRRGATWKAIALIMRESGFGVSADTIRLAIGQPKKRSNENGNN
jgi:hypothetical protein